MPDCGSRWQEEKMKSREKYFFFLYMKLTPASFNGIPYMLDSAFHLITEILKAVSDRTLNMAARGYIGGFSTVLFILKSWKIPD